MPPKRKKIVNTAKTSGELVFRDDDQLYARATKPLGDKRFHIVLDDGRDGIGKLRGNFRRRDVVMAGTTVLVSELMNDGKFDILLRYDEKETKMLKKYGELSNLEKSVLEWQRLEDERLYGTSSCVDHIDDDDGIDFDDDDCIDDI